LKIYLLIIAVFLSACNSTPKQEVEVAPVVNQNEEVPTSKKIYFFQHKILPEWTFTTEGKFYADLLRGDLAHLKLAATEVISNEYANGISSEVINDSGAILIKFPKPKAMANCYFVLILKNKEEFSFYTYEKTMNFGDDDPVIGVVGSWSPEGSHGNLGGRTYSKSSDFVSDILRKNG
jgi:hypothetical protein